MAALSRAKSIQLIVTGVLMVVFSCGLFGLLYMIHSDKYYFGKSDIFNRNTSFWVAIPITISGLIGVLAGITTKTSLVTLYLITTLVSTGLAGLVSVGYGLRVNSIRAGCGEDSTCKNSDTVVLIGTIVLLSAILLTISLLATVKACQAKWGPSKNQRKKRAINAVQYTTGKTNGPATVPVHGRANLGAEIQANGGSSGCDSTKSPNETNHAYESLQPDRIAKHDDTQPDRISGDDGISPTDNTAKDDGTSSNQAVEDHGTSQSDETGKDDGTSLDKPEEDHGKSQSDTTAKDNDTCQIHSPPKDDGKSAYYEPMDGQTETSPHYESLDAKTRNQDEHEDVKANGAVKVNEAFESDETAF